MTIEKLLENLQAFFNEMETKVTIDKTDFTELEKKIIDNSEEMERVSL